MEKEIYINVNTFETRVALMENRNLAEIFIERAREKGISGNIYRGKVTKVLPGMQVAFVDIGQERSGFLHQKDVIPQRLGAISTVLQSKKSINESSEEEFDPFNGSLIIDKTEQPIEELLMEGQELMVQVGKDPIGNKGARISTYVSLPGRYLVFMPMVDQIGVSRRIESSAERDRLRKVIDNNRTPGKGYIIRTAAEGATEEELKADIAFLERMWERLLKKNEKASSPVLLHRDLDIVLRSIRDLFQPDVKRVIIDSVEDYERCVEFTNSYLGDSKPEIEVYTSKEPIFDSLGLEMEIDRAIGRKVWLKSGGYIVIDHTEALVAIDVNTGKFVGKHTLEETILKTNLEAVREIVYQLKLRNLGGLIIIDFIDMEKEESKEKVNHALEEALRQDRSRTKILSVSELGLVEMTRKRTRTNLNRILCQPCPHCDGKGFAKSPQTVCYEIFREIKRRVASNPLTKRIFLTVSQRISATLMEEESDFLEKLEAEHNYKITINTDLDFPDEHFEVNFQDLDQQV